MQRCKKKRVNSALRLKCPGRSCLHIPGAVFSKNPRLALHCVYGKKLNFSNLGKENPQ